MSRSSSPAIQRPRFTYGRPRKPDTSNVDTSFEVGNSSVDSREDLDSSFSLSAGLDVPPSSDDLDANDASPASERARSAPGDEEDFVTPIRPNNAGKRVKWDRGLETAIYLDEIELQPGRRKIAEKVVPSKGCLVIDPEVRL